MNTDTHTLSTALVAPAATGRSLVTWFGVALTLLAWSGTSSAQGSADAESLKQAAEAQVGEMTQLTQQMVDSIAISSLMDVQDRLIKLGGWIKVTGYNSIIAEVADVTGLANAAQPTLPRRADPLRWHFTTRERSVPASARTMGRPPLERPWQTLPLPSPSSA